MSFHSPQLLWLLAVPALLVLWEVTRRQRGALANYPKMLRAEAAPGRLQLATATTDHPRRGRVRWRLWLGMALAVSALARPQWGEVEEQVFDQAREIIIAVDLSRSMLAPDVPPSRLDRAKLLITSLLERLEGERVGLIVFAGTAFLQSPLSADYEILREFLPALGPDFLPEGGTNYTQLLQTALDAFGRTEGTDRYLIVLSDGESQTDDWRRLVDPLRERNVRAISLGIGTPEGAMLPDGSGGLVKDERGAVVLSRLNAETLEELARRTSGVYRDASRWVDLAQLLQETVEAGQRGQFSETTRARAIERFQWFLAPALLLLIWSLWREFQLQPRAQRLKLTADSSKTNQRSVPAASTTLSLILALLAVMIPNRSYATADAVNFAAPVSQIVARLSAQGRIQAPAYAELADATLTYGQRMQSAGQATPPGAIQDALAAVAAGEALDPRAADWARLRTDLEALLPPEEPPPPPEDQEKPDESEDSSEKDESSSQPKSQEQPGQRSEGDSDSEPSDPSQSPPSDSGEPRPDTPPESPQQDSAFGDMNEPPPPPEDSPSETQQVGGRTDRRPPQNENPALTVPLQKLDQLRQQDSPATLHQLLQDPGSRTPATGRDW
jgi:Ca-activated chloride channel homolog